MSGPSAKALRARREVPASGAAAPSSVTPLKPANRLRRPVRRGETLFGAGDPFGTLFVVRVGFFKSLASSANGQVQVTGFPMVGDVLGLDGIDTGFHQCDVVAFDNAEVFVLPFAECEQWARETAHGQRLMRRTLAREITRGHDHMLLLSATRAEQRVAIFLLDMAERHRRLGDSRSHFALRMTRQDIGSYLGLQLETVSRLLSHFQREGYIQVQGREIAMLDFPALWRLSGQTPDGHRPMVAPLLDPQGNLSLAADADDGRTRM
jgi:CRP/FNR family transcriptional regulator, anaerobic regulatory protein